MGIHLIYIPYTRAEDYTPEEAQNEYIELLVKAGRRCAYDLSHAADLVESYSPEIKETFRLRAKHWQKVFNPGNDHKNYRAQLHAYIDQLEYKTHKLIKLLEERGIDHSEITQDDIPF